MKIKIIAFVLFLTSAANTYSQISFKTEYIGSSSYWLDNADDPRERVGNTRGSAMVYHGNINIPLSMKTNEKQQPVIWGAGIGGTYVALHNKNFTENLVISEMMNLQVGVYHLRPLRGRWSLMASIGMGAYTPFADPAKIRAKHLLGSLGAIFIYQFSPQFKLGGGIAINNTFGYPMAFPAFYLDWNSNGKFDFLASLGNGLELSAGLNIHKNFSLALVAEMNGQSALMEKDGKDVIFTHQYIVGGLRSLIKIGKNLSIPITAGVNAFRPASFSDRKLKAMFKNDNDYYFQVSPYDSLGLNVNL